MNHIVLAAIALTCTCVPALAETASEPVTWDALSAVFGWVGFVLLILVAGIVVFGVVGGIIIKAWSH